MSAFTPVYLLRHGNPAYLARRFLTSFMKTAGHLDVGLIVLLKGFPSNEMPVELRKLPARTNDKIELVHVDDSGMDLTAYRAFCQQRDAGHYLFVNSHSYFVKQLWYDAFCQALRKTGGAGILGASASLEGGTNVGRDFPNPHIRTNGFLVHTDDYLAAAVGELQTKLQCHLFESGEKSLTRYFIDKGQPVLLVDGKGQSFEPVEWPTSETFRLADQQQLMIADNRSDKFHAAFSRRRLHHAHASWGRDISVTQISPIVALQRTIWTRYCAQGHKVPLLRSMKENRYLA